MVQTRAAAKRIDSGPPLPDPAPKTKKRRGDAPPARRRRGKPGELCQLNLDVLFLLAAYVHPLDLLNLARTCKSLRELLMDKASTFVWKTARTQTNGLPDCPADLTEPEYANLVFYARCHGCSKYAKKILWSLRRRYCPECRLTRLCSLNSSSCDMRLKYALPMEHLAVDGEKMPWVDQEQLNVIAHEYDCAADKDQFLEDKQKECRAVYSHARQCKQWEGVRAYEHKRDLDNRRGERYNSIFERLEQHGYLREINYFGRSEIHQSCKSFFRTSKKLTDKEWSSILPAWIETMNGYRSRRLKQTVHEPRRRYLIAAYDNYAASRSPDAPVSDLLPHVTEVARFAPFRDLIHAPEEVDVGSSSFEPAFEQLPALVDEWKKQLDVEFAKLVEIPSDLPSDVAAGGTDVASSSVTLADAPQEPTDRLRLACAVFNSSSETTAHYPDVLSSARAQQEVESDQTRTVWDRFGVKFFPDAVYIVRACGLDPSVATIEDADRTDARLRCTQCARPTIMSWRRAVRHAGCYHRAWGDAPAPALRWERVDAHLEAIRAAEGEIKTDAQPPFRVRCAVCRFRVGDAAFRDDTERHLRDRHGVQREDVREGVHYKGLRVDSEERRPAALEMVDEGGAVTFKLASCY